MFCQQRIQLLRRKTCLFRFIFTFKTSVNERYPITLVTSGLLHMQDWTQYQTSRGRRSAYVWNLEQFNEANPIDTDYMLGRREKSLLIC
ncbi:hypothetical protein DPMN_102113 [Dreissena polymorpha]|uniref:Uncharacterized protein n=1 Tax=Dreissena polymorpha TaxID=45954 RepID=A0A9D4R9N9_DREPO|nr:hypothetical protein DPMN_102113 [Dreissena polymorpha]